MKRACLPSGFRWASSGALPLLAAFLWAVALAAGCGDFTLFGDDEENAPPQAVASADNTTPRACAKDTVQLDGTGSSDPEGDSLTYQWAFTVLPGGSTAVLQDATLSQASFQPDEPGSYTVELTVTDEGGRSDSDTVTVTASEAPIADGGADQQVSPGAEVTLDGSGSANPQEECTSDNLSFRWSLTDPEGGQSDLGSEALVSFTAGMEGTYTATLTVENEAGSDSDEVQIEVGSSALEALQAGPYAFTVEEVDDGVFGGLLSLVFPAGTQLADTLDVPSLEEIPVTRTVSLSPVSGSFVEGEVEIDREGPTDDFYTLTGTASGTVSIPSVVECQMGADSNGTLTPESTNTVTLSLTLSNPVVSGSTACTDLADEQGTIQVVLSGELQSGE